MKMKMVLLNLSRHLLPKHLHTYGDRKHVINAVVTRNRELISKSGSHVRAADGVAKGETPLAIFFSSRKACRFEGCFRCVCVFTRCIRCSRCPGDECAKMLPCIRLPCMCVSVCVWWVGGGQPCTDHASDHRFPEFGFKISFYFIHVRLLVDIQFRSATVHSSVTQPEPASLGSSVLPRNGLCHNVSAGL